jgi:hypothetical protein
MMSKIWRSGASVVCFALSSGLTHIGIHNLLTDPSLDPNVPRPPVVSYARALADGGQQFAFTGTRPAKRGVLVIGDSMMMGGATSVSGELVDVPGELQETLRQNSEMGEIQVIPFAEPGLGISDLLCAR